MSDVNVQELIDRANSFADFTTGLTGAEVQFLDLVILTYGDLIIAGYIPDPGVEIQQIAQALVNKFDAYYVECGIAED